MPAGTSDPPVWLRSVRLGSQQLNRYSNWRTTNLTPFFPQNACVSPDSSTMPGSSSSTSDQRSSCQFRYDGPISSFPNNTSTADRNRLFSGDQTIYTTPPSILAGYIRPSDPFRSDQMCLFPKRPYLNMPITSTATERFGIHQPTVKVEHKISFFSSQLPTVC